VLALALPLFFLNYALTHQVIAWNGQRAYLAVAGGALAVNVVANVMLVPSLAGVGAALATVATEVAVSLGSVAALRAASVRAPESVALEGRS
jgi:O-antigen/teichoic acid export membrane protein